MPEDRRPARNRRIALIWAQFSAYHVDRLEATARRLAGQAEIIAVEVCARSHAYRWEASAAVAGARKLCLFPGQAFEDVHPVRRWWAALRAVRGCDTVFIGLGYNEPDAVLLAWVLRVIGVRVVMMTASKWDDRPRRIGVELVKRIVLAPFAAALVGGARQRRYVAFLGFHRRPVLCGYNTVSVRRVRRQAGAGLGPAAPAFADRPFIFVGRFVPRKQIDLLLDGYARYVARAGKAAHRLVLIGAGECEAALRAHCARLGVAHLVDWPGFLGAADVAAQLARGLALVLVSREEPWGLVVNEALAVGLPVIVSAQVGACDTLVGNLENGFVIMPGPVADRDASGVASPVASIAAAMAGMAANADAWAAMSANAARRAWLGDVGRFADAVAVLTATEDANRAAARRSARFAGESGPEFDRPVSGRSVFGGPSSRGPQFRCRA